MFVFKKKIGFLVGSTFWVKFFHICLFLFFSEFLFVVSYVLRHSCPFPTFRPEPPPVGAPTGGVQLFFQIHSYELKNNRENQTTTSLETFQFTKKKLCLILKIFIGDLLYFSRYISAYF